MLGLCEWLQDVDARSLVLSWQTLAAMVSISSVVVSVAVVYLRLFVENRLGELRGSIVDAIGKTSAESYLGKHVGELLELRLQQIERRIDKLEAK